MYTYSGLERSEVFSRWGMKKILGGKEGGKEVLWKWNKTHHFVPKLSLNSQQCQAASECTIHHTRNEYMPSYLFNNSRYSEGSNKQC